MQRESLTAKVTGKVAGAIDVNEENGNYTVKPREKKHSVSVRIRGKPDRKKICSTQKKHFAHGKRFDVTIIIVIVTTDVRCVRGIREVCVCRCDRVAADVVASRE